MAEVFRDGKVHVLSEKCHSCIGRSPKDGQIQGLEPGRITGLVKEAKGEVDGAGNIPCHNTIYDPDVKPAICRWFYDLPDRPALLEAADRLGFIEFDDPPEKRY